jgi:hypothetical protein
MNGPHKRTLLKALQIVGSKERLAAALELEVAQLEGYLNGEDLTHKVFMDALDIVANGPRLPHK